MSYLAEVIDRAEKQAEQTRVLALAKSSAMPSPLAPTPGSDAGFRGGDLLAHGQRDTAYAAIRLVSQRVAGLPVRVEQARRDGSWAEIKSPITDAIKDPNPWHTESVLIGLAAAWLQTSGEFHWLVVPLPAPDDDGRTAWIHPLPATWCKPLHEKGRPFASWEVRSPWTADKLTVPASHIVWGFTPDLTNPFKAHSPLMAGMRGVQTDQNVAESQRNQFANGMWPGVVVKVGSNAADGSRPMLTTEQRRELIAWITQQHRGVRKDGAPFICDSLIDSITPFSHSPREMAYERSAPVAEARVAAAFGVSLASLGRNENSNRASSAVSDSHLVSNVVNPLAKLISDTLTGWLVPLLAPGQENKLRVCIGPASAADPEMDLKYWELAAQHGCVTENELRSKIGLAPTTNGDTPVGS